MRRLWLWAVLAAGWSAAAAGEGAAILGIPPSYGPPTLSAMPSPTATRIWMPGLDEGYDPQGLTVVDGSILIAAYRSERLRQNRGPCRVFRVDPASGHETGHFDVPAPCGHAGGLAYAGDGILYVADTRALFAVELASAFGAGPPLVRTHPLGPGLTGSLAASDRDGIWIGSYETRGPGRIFKFESRMLRALRDGEPLLAGMATRQVAIPAYAQGAAVDRDGQRLWVARSAVGWGAVDTVDLKSGAVIQRHVALPGLEGIAFDAAGHLWGVSEAGARHVYDHPLARLISPFHPIILDLGATLRPIHAVHSARRPCNSTCTPQAVCVIPSSSDRERLEAIVADRRQPRKPVERTHVVLALAERGPVQAILMPTSRSWLNAVENFSSLLTR